MNQQPCPFMSIAPPLLRPWVWLQLFLIQIWVEHHQRAVFMQMDKRTCRITIRYIGDAPASPSTYTYKAPHTPAWDRTDAHKHLSDTGRPVSQPVIPEFRASEISGTQCKMQQSVRLDPG